MLRRSLILFALLACAFGRYASPPNDAIANTLQNSDQIDHQKFAKSAASIYNGDLKFPEYNCSVADDSNVVYKLYTRQKPHGEDITANGLVVRNSAINSKKPLKVLVHSWLQDGKWAVPIARDYLYTQNVDVLVVDWSAYSKNCSVSSTSKVITPFVGESLANVLKIIISEGHRGSQMHLIGFSHGAHMVGIAGRLMAPHTLARVTGLDPLKLDEINVPGGNKLTAGDARFVDVIVTSIPAYGFEEEIGTATFYPNGGLFQYHDSCSKYANDYEKQALCGHALSYKIFAQSLVSPYKFLAIQCASWEKYQSGACKGADLAHLGEFVDRRNTKGKYYLYVNEITE